MLAIYCLSPALGQRYGISGHQIHCDFAKFGVVPMIESTAWVIPVKGEQKNVDSLSFYLHFSCQTEIKMYFTLYIVTKVEVIWRKFSERESLIHLCSCFQ